MMRTASRRGHPSVANLSQPAASSWAAVIEGRMQSTSFVERAASALCCGGLLEGGARPSSAETAAPAGALVRALFRACSGAAAAEDRSTGGSHRLGIGLWRDAAAISSWKAAQACGWPQLSPTTWLCQLHAVLSGCLQLDGIFHAAAAQQPAGVASAWLQRQVSSAPAQLAGPMSAPWHYASIRSPVVAVHR